jgi:hypothetical protein
MYEITDARDHVLEHALDLRQEIKPMDLSSPNVQISEKKKRRF